MPKEKNYQRPKTIHIEREVHNGLCDFISTYKINMGFLTSRMIEKELQLLAKDPSRLQTLLTK